MIEQTSCRKRQNSAVVTKILGFVFPLLAVIAACCICFFSKMPIAIENPAVLVLASLFILLPFKSNPSGRLLQKIVVFYLISVPVNELSSQYFQVPFALVNISASYGTVVLSLCAISFIAEIVKPANLPPKIESTNILYGWMVAFVIIAAHMALLAPLLNKSYGYGYEHDLSALGNMSLYLLLFIFLWGRLENIRLRQAASLILAVFFSAVIIAKR